jgi:hypothetical protein
MGWAGRHRAANRAVSPVFQDLLEVVERRLGLDLRDDRHLGAKGGHVRASPAHIVGRADERQADIVHASFQTKAQILRSLSPRIGRSGNPEGTLTPLRLVSRPPTITRHRISSPAALSTRRAMDPSARRRVSLADTAPGRPAYDTLARSRVPSTGAVVRTNGWPASSVMLPRR